MAIATEQRRHCQISQYQVIYHRDGAHRFEIYQHGKKLSEHTFSLTTKPYQALKKVCQEIPDPACVSLHSDARCPESQPVLDALVQKLGGQSAGFNGRQVWIGGPSHGHH